MELFTFRSKNFKETLVEKVIRVLIRDSMKPAIKSRGFDVLSILGFFAHDVLLF